MNPLVRFALEHGAVLIPPPCTCGTRPQKGLNHSPELLGWTAEQAESDSEWATRMYATLAATNTATKGTTR